VPLIIDTDASFDVDDVVAICLAHALMDRGEVDIKAIVHDAGIPEGIGAVSVLNSFYGRDDIPLGAYKGSFGREPNGGGWVRGAYVDDLVNNWYSPVKDSSQVPDAVEVYRKVLSEAADRSIVISAIGFVTNIADLLRSGPDQYSDLNGVDLVGAKVKSIVWQGGWYPPIHGFGHETYNWDCGRGYYNTDGCDGESEYAINNMPSSVDMVYSDIGDELYTGSSLSWCAGDENPCRAALIDQQGFGNGRCSWDGVVTLRAIRGTADSVGASEAGRGDGRATVSYWGANDWVDDGSSGHSWLVLNGAWDNDYNTMEDTRRNIEGIIDDLLCNEPSASTESPPNVEGQTLVNPGTGLCLHVHSNSNHPNDYTNVDVLHCDGSVNQLWQMNSNQQIIHAVSGKCLDADANNGDEVVVYACSGAEWQSWELKGDTIVNAHTGFCLDVWECVDGCSDGTDVKTAQCWGGPNQNWVFS